VTDVETIVDRVKSGANGTDIEAIKDS